MIAPDIRNGLLIVRFITKLHKPTEISKGNCSKGISSETLD
jgi:hypothetical protein